MEPVLVDRYPTEIPLSFDVQDPQATHESHAFSLRHLDRPSSSCPHDMIPPLPDDVHRDSQGCLDLDDRCHIEKVRPRVQGRVKGSVKGSVQARVQGKLKTQRYNPNVDPKLKAKGTKKLKGRLQPKVQPRVQSNKPKT
jgi:hypothetical protein